MKKNTFQTSDVISETMLICLYAKASESKKKNPLIIDKVAEQLMETIDYDFSKFKSKGSSVGNAIRSSHFDRMAEDFIKNRPHPIVVNVGCGLDARIHRLGETAEKAIFYGLDLPDVIEIRKKLIPPLKNEILISESMLETNWLDQLKKEHPKGDFIFIIEGVLMYFEEKDNRKILSQIAERFPNAEIHFDTCSKWMSRNTSLHATVGKTKAGFKSGIDTTKEIENWSPKLKCIQSWCYTDFKGYKRMGIINYILMNCVPIFKNAFKIWKVETKNRNSL